jgi:RIO kinase 1
MRSEVRTADDHILGASPSRLLLRNRDRISGAEELSRNLAYEEDLDDEIYETFYRDDEEAEPDPLQTFLDDGTIVEVVGEVKSGKEGTVYSCRPHPSMGIELVAAKVFRSREQRSFRNQSTYREGVVILNKHDARAVKKKTAWGRTFEEASWKYHEYEVLKALSAAGADVPKPLKLSERVLLMEYIGDGSGAAPKLQGVQLDRAEARPIYERIVRNIELFLSQELIHGDLSPYNVLYWQGDITIIDFPQAVDPRTNRNAFTLLGRDIRNICQYFRRHGIHDDPEAITRALWRRYQRAEL